MTPLVVVGVIAASPIILLTVLRVNATLVFLSLCLGYVLMQFVGPEAASTVGIIMSDGRTNEQLVMLFLLFAPAALTTVFMIRSVRGKAKQVLNFLISVAVGSLLFLLTEPLLTTEMREALTSTPIWFYLQKLQVLIITLGAIFSLLFLWLQRPKPHKDDKHHK